jgi:hypothetical protein
MELTDSEGNKRENEIARETGRPEEKRSVEPALGQCGSGDARDRLRSLLGEGSVQSLGNVKMKFVRTFSIDEMRKMVLQGGIFPVQHFLAGARLGGVRVRVLKATPAGG